MPCIVEFFFQIQDGLNAHLLQKGRVPGPYLVQGLVRFMVAQIINGEAVCKAGYGLHGEPGIHLGLQPVHSGSEFMEYTFDILGLPALAFLQVADHFLDDLQIVLFFLFFYILLPVRAGFEQPCKL